MKKLLMILLTSTTIAACGAKQEESTEKTNSKSDPKTMFIKHPINRVGYITELNKELNDNYYRATIEDLKEEYNYRMDGTADAAYRLKYSTTRVYSVDGPDELKKSFERLNENNVGLTIVENKEFLNKLLNAKSGKTEINIWKEVMENNIYGGYMAMIGKDSQYYLTNEGKVGMGKNKWEWKSDKIATFEFSEIVSAYYMGYITQYTFGLDSDGQKKTVGYILGSTYQSSTDRPENIKKALAFRQGVLDAVTEKQTGEATFASKTETSDDPEEHTLVWRMTDLESVIPKLVKSSNYKDKDHSLTYFAGASSEYNEIIASFLMEQEVKNSQGHKLIGEKASTTAGDMFESSIDTNYMEATTTNDEGEENHIKNKSVTGRVSMFYNKDKKAYRNDEYNIELANTYAVKELLKSVFKDDNLATYFGKHTYVGTFPLVYKPGENQVPSDAQPAKTITEELKLELIEKRITEEQFKTKSDFLGWSE